MTLVIDASVAALWVLPQPGSERAAALRSQDRLIAPTLVVAEIGSALWKAARRGDLSRADALAALDVALRHFDVLVPLEEQRARALELAIDLQHPIYDCFYLALAARERCPYITADKRLLKVGAKLKAIDLRAL